MSESPAVTATVGQVWQQRSGPLKGRRLKIVETHPHTGLTQVETIRNAADVQAALDGNPKPEWVRWAYRPVDVRGRRTWMQTKTLRPPRYALVEDVEEVRDA